MPLFGLLSEASHRAKGLELGQKALFDAVYLCEVKESFIGQFGIGSLFKNREEDFTGLLVVFLTNGEDPTEEVGSQ